MTDTMERRDQIPRPVDAAGHHILRANLATTEDLITRAEGDDTIGFRGDAIMFNSRTWIGSRKWGFWEQIAPESVRKTLNEADIRFLINHDPNLLLARNRAGTLKLKADDTALRVDADMAPVSYARDLAILLERRDITQMSFAFDPISWKREEAEDGETLFTITELRLFDVSVVTYPAYEDTDAGLRSLAWDMMVRTAGIDPADGRKLARHITTGEPIDDEIEARFRSFLGGTVPPTPTPPESTSGSEPPASTRDESGDGDEPPAPPTTNHRERLAAMTDALKE